jgi:hypothetical protein
MKVLLNMSFLILSLILLNCAEESDELQCTTYYLESSTNVNTPGKPKSTYLYNNQEKLSKILDENGNITTQYTYEGNNLIQVDGGQVRWKFAYDITGKVKYANLYIYDFLVPYDSLTFEYIANGQIAKQSHYNLNSFSGNYQFTLRRYSQFEYDNNNGILQKTFETNASIYPAFEQVFTRNFTYDDKPRSGHPELFFYEDVSSELPSHINNFKQQVFTPSSTGVKSYINFKYKYNQEGIVTGFYIDNTLIATYEYSCEPAFE